jgi:hypothetical protein
MFLYLFLGFTMFKLQVHHVGKAMGGGEGVGMALGCPARSRFSNVLTLLVLAVLLFPHKFSSSQLFVLGTDLREWLV